MQFDFAGRLALADGRYLARVAGEDGESVLVIETRGAPPPPGKRRQRPRASQSGAAVAALPLARATAVRAFESFAAEHEAAVWFDRVLGNEERTAALLAEASALLNRALHVHATASADPRGAELSSEQAVAVRIGYGSGEQVAGGRFTAASEVDVRSASALRRRGRPGSNYAEERTAAVLAGRERLDACETLLLRARADLDADRGREAALQLRVGLEALLAELSGAATDPGHAQDMATLRERRAEAERAAAAALAGELDAATGEQVGELLAICERILRRRRILRN